MIVVCVLSDFVYWRWVFVCLLLVVLGLVHVGFGLLVVVYLVGVGLWDLVCCGKYFELVGLCRCCV